MSKSRLHYHLLLRELAYTLDKDECVDVLESLREELQYSSFGELLTQILIDCTKSLSIDSLDKIYNVIKSKLDGNTHNLKKLKNTPTINDNTNIKTPQIIFPLFSLPIDLISEISLYLNENDIFQFEQCCSLFYKMVNKLSYLNKSNNFKTFIITHKRFQKIISPQYSFYKYSKAKTLQFDLPRYHSVRGDDFDNFANELRFKWEQAQYIAKENDNWLQNVFKSIEKLILDYDSTFVLTSLLPIDILFDPLMSHLNVLEFDHDWDPSYDNEMIRSMNRFETEYLELQKKLKLKSQQIKRLRLLKHNSNCDYLTIYGPRYIESQQIFIGQIELDCRSPIAMNLRGNCCPGVELLTFSNDAIFKHIDKIEYNDSRKYHKIKTLCLSKFSCFSQSDICTNYQLIESLNLQNSLKNLMINIIIWDGDIHAKDDIDRWKMAINYILQKKYFYNLENVNLLFETNNSDGLSLNMLFTILTENTKELKYQFKQFNVGIRILNNTYPIETYHVWKWNKDINDKYLDEKQEDIYLCRYQDDKIFDRFKTEYFSLEKQWW